MHAKWHLSCISRILVHQEFNYRNTSLIRHWSYKVKYAGQHFRLYLYVLNLGDTIKRKWKISSSHCGDLQQWENARTRCRVPYKWDNFISEWGDSPYRPVPYRWGITIRQQNLASHFNSTNWCCLKWNYLIRRELSLPVQWGDNYHRKSRKKSNSFLYWSNGHNG